MFGGRFNGGFFALRVWGAYWGGLFSEFTVSNVGHRRPRPAGLAAGVQVWSVR